VCHSMISQLYHDEEKRRDDDSYERIFVPILDKLGQYGAGLGLLFVSQRFFPVVDEERGFDIVGGALYFVAV
jgi:hypothetical protein